MYVRVWYAEQLQCPVQDAAREKLRAGEGRNVEHVALYDEKALRAEEEAKPARKRGRRSKS